MRSLEFVQFVDAKNWPIDGLVSVRDAASTNSPHERAHLLQAEAFEHIDYLYFRRFNDGRSSQVAAYVVDNSQQRLSDHDLAHLHHKLWLHGVAPLVYVAWPTRVDILSCARKPDFWTEQGTVEYKPADKIELAADISDSLAKKRRRFSAYRLADGTFWDDRENQRLAKDDATAHRSLIQAIVEADKELAGATHPVRRRLLVLMVLVKYLEDRRVFPSGLFGRFHAGARSFREILCHGDVDEVKRLLSYFEKNKFNGDVFSLGEDSDSLTERDLRILSKLVEGKTLGGQKHFWELFSFEHIPVEVISRLYQRFVTGHGAVYTPPFLVALLLDQAMPYERLTGEEKVLDPACGSGIFLVGAFKRLVILWRSRNRWQKPTASVLKGILAKCIHGVELEPGAVDLTAFSLALAICDALHPEAIWRDLEFDKLCGRNLRQGDFFEPATFGKQAGHDWPKKFDVVIGNPPFESELTPPARIVDATRPKDEAQLPDNQVAFLFLEHSLLSLAPGGAVCLLQPHGLLYNSTSADFRKHLLQLCRLDTVLDFVSMRGMFEGADPKTVAWHAVHESPADHSINHLTFRRTYSASQRIAFEIDHYDWHVISQRQALENQFVWRVDLLGGGRLHELSERFRKMKTLAKVIAEKGDGWDYGEGFIAGKKGKRVPAPFLTGKPLLPTRAFTDAGIDRTCVGPDKATVEETLFKSPYTEMRYSPPLVLFKAHDSFPVEFWDDGFLAYRDKIIGIHAPKSEKSALREIFKTFKEHRRFYRFCCGLNGTQAWTGKATVPLKQDFDLLPFPDDPAELELAFWENALKEDVLNHMAKFIRLGQNSNLLRKAAEPSEVEQYSSLYCRMLGSLYHNLKALEPIFLNGLIAQPFYFGARPDVPWFGMDCNDSLQRLIYDESRESLRTVRVVRYYEGNAVLIVKPDRLRYWIPSTAIRDADDTLIDLRQQGW